MSALRPTTRHIPKTLGRSVPFSTQCVLRTAQPPGKPPTTAIPLSGKKPEAPVIDAPRSYGQKVTEFTPQPLPRPIGMNSPPRVGQNTGIDTRTLKEKHADLTNWDKHLERREDLKTKIGRPYFRDWNNLQMHNGKSFIAPMRVFRADKALYFPNLHGKTLETSGVPRDTTTVLTNKVSIVAMMSGRWAEQQISTWLGPQENPEIHEALQQFPEAQIVRVNFEDNTIKSWLISLFIGGLRRAFPESEWGKYFLVTKGITDDIREHIGYLNSKVGYVYIVDQHCRIRWAGSGAAHPIENESMVKGLQKVVTEFREEFVAAELKKQQKLVGKIPTAKK